MATIQIEGKTYYDIDGIVEKIGVGKFTVRGYIRSGKLKAVKVGRRYWIEEKELSNLFATGTGRVARKSKKA
ncbi:MAG: helix-turn-helix domain-containing protein [Methanosarcina sp.]|nr:helix-turn-helix domain-containing protein [Methanosarcina sp.]